LGQTVPTAVIRQPPAHPCGLGWKRLIFEPNRWLFTKTAQSVFMLFTGMFTTCCVVHRPTARYIVVSEKLVNTFFQIVNKLTLNPQQAFDAT
jgi:hypothetical protein